MLPNYSDFHHRVAFRLGMALLITGVLAHLPMFTMASSMGYRLAGMPMDIGMLYGMGLIVIGLVLASYGLISHVPPTRKLYVTAIGLQMADDTPLNWRHWQLIIVLFVALAIDVMKPATIGFVMPGMVVEYGLPKSVVAWLALVALTGTTLGSLLWGRIADIAGRRSAILLAALMFIGTSICGTMPSFIWNLAMCFLMGMSAGGLLPITFTLMAEIVPRKHRGWLLVLLGGVGTSVGYLLAASSAFILEPVFGWRSLWLLGAPTGLLIMLLQTLIPESPRFLANAGLREQAQEVLYEFTHIVAHETVIDDIAPNFALPEAPVRFMDLLDRQRAGLTCALILCGIAWGLTNFGFLLWLPSNLAVHGVNPLAVNGILARSGALALPGILIVALLYQRWNSLKSLILSSFAAALSLFSFIALEYLRISSSTALVIATVSLLVSSSGIIATLIPYAAEIYPLQLRASGVGAIAASSKFGGMLAALAVIYSLFKSYFAWAILIIILLMISTTLLAKFGIHTNGRSLEDIQRAIGKSSKRNI